MKKARVPRFFFRSLAMHLLITLLPLLLFSAATGVFINRRVSRQAETALRTSLLTARDSASRVFNQADSLVLAFNQSSIYARSAALLRDASIQYADNVSMQPTLEWMRSIADAHAFIDSIYVYIVNDNGRLLSSLTGITHLRNLQDTGWYDALTARGMEKTSWIDVRDYANYSFEAGNAKRTVTVYRCLRGGRCWVVMNLNYEYLKQLLTRSLVYEEQEILLADGAGRILLGEADIAADTLSDYIARYATHDDTAIFADKTHMLSVGAVENEQLYLIAFIPKRAVYSLGRVLLRVSVLLLGLCGVMCVFLSLQYAVRERKKLYALYTLIDETNDNRLPQMPAVRAYDAYSYIEQNIVSSFIRQNNLRMELQQKSLEAKSMELLALQAQINPHFLVNTLRTIYWKTAAAFNGINNDACVMLEDMGELFGLMTGNPNELIPFSRECHYLQCYLSLQQKRFPDKFVFTFEVAEACRETPILKMLLQPLVENCFQHAMPDAGLLHMTLHVRQDSEYMTLRLRDDGVGMEREKLEALRAGLGKQTAYKHIGLLNTAKRIMLRYGSENPLTVESAPGQGTSIVLRIPIRPAAS